jgi:hypothetical protein
MELCGHRQLGSKSSSVVTKKYVPVVFQQLIVQGSFKGKIQHIAIITTDLKVQTCSI